MHKYTLILFGVLKKKLSPRAIYLHCYSCFPWHGFEWPVTPCTPERHVDTVLQVQVRLTFRIFYLLNFRFLPTYVEIILIPSSWTHIRDTRSEKSHDYMVEHQRHVVTAQQDKNNNLEPPGAAQLFQHFIHLDNHGTFFNSWCRNMFFQSGHLVQK